MPPDPRTNLPQLLPRPQQYLELSHESNVDELDHPPKRQAVSNACNNCRKRKAKCDGGRPQCYRCQQRGLTCEFFAPVNTTPQQAERLQASKYKAVVELLRRSSFHESLQILHKIRETNGVEEAANSIADAQLLWPTTLSPTSTSTLLEPKEPDASVSPSFITSRKLSTQSEQQNTVLNNDADLIIPNPSKTILRVNHAYSNIPSRIIPFSQWTSVSSDDQYMNHLINMFFTWDNTVERAIYRPMFEEDISTLNPTLNDSFHGRFCSRFLVNALLAVSCLYSLNPSISKDLNASKSRSRQWANEADTLLATTSNQTPSIPLLQGLYALFLYEGAIGSGVKSLKYFMQAIEVYNALNHGQTLQAAHGIKSQKRLEREKQAASWCMWGFYCSEWRWSQAFGFKKSTAKPVIERAWHDADFTLSDPEYMDYWWSPFPTSLETQRSMKIEIRDADVHLSELADQVLNFVYGEPPPRTNSEHALRLYNELIEYKHSNLSNFILEETILPGAILLHTSLEGLITTLLLPFTTDFKTPFSRFDPVERCCEHADTIMSTVWAFRTSAILRFEYWLTHLIGNAIHIVLPKTTGAPSHLDTLLRGCRCLQEMSISHVQASDVLCGIRTAFKRHNITMPIYLQEYFQDLQHSKDGIMHYTVPALQPSSEEIVQLEGHMQKLFLYQLLEDFDADEANYRSY